ncbi:hypothetical protein [Bacterioplanes sanyensis]|uniref:hypothetical protein n=1 Tax=Bacterioplanes sanyensis TaxID=1249553 RepID=UPI001671C56C|nr:hypothetical protein [Bacterioplanes sanyensis]
MIEVLVTLAISIIGLLGISMMQLNINKATIDSGARSHAIWMIDEITNKMYANWDNLEHYDTSKNGFTCNSYGGKLCLDSTPCTGKEMAAYDLWTSSCPAASKEANVNKNAADFIPEPKLTIKPVLSTRSAKITVQWTSRVSSDSDLGGGKDPGGTVSISRDIQL